MARKKIQKAPKQDKAEDNHSGSEPEPQDDQVVDPPKADLPQSNAGPSNKKRGNKGKQTQKKQKGSTKETQQVQLFTENFNKRVDEFKGFYQQYLQLKAGANNSIQTKAQFNRVTGQVRAKIQSACQNVLREDISDAQKWIEEQQATIRDQISNVDKCQADTRKTLQNAGTFSKSQIDNQTQLFRKKKSNLEQHLNELQQIKTRAVRLYKKNQSAIDQQ